MVFESIGKNIAEDIAKKEVDKKTQAERATQVAQEQKEWEERKQAQRSMAKMVAEGPMSEEIAPGVHEIKEAKKKVDEAFEKKD